MRSFAFFLVFALLVCYAAARFAGRLTRGLAFAAAAVLRAFAKVAGLYSFDMFHFTFLRKILLI